MPEITFTNQQTVHVTHPFGTFHVPIYVEAEGFERLVEKSYGDGYVDVLFGRVMSSGLVSYNVGSGSSVIGTGGSSGTSASSSSGGSRSRTSGGDDVPMAPGIISPGSAGAIVSGKA